MKAIHPKHPAVLAGVYFDALDLFCHAILLTAGWPSRESSPPGPDSALAAAG
jgi:hypothetical protein